MPSFLAIVMSLPLRPIVTIRSRSESSPVVRSGLIGTKVSPLSAARKTRLAGDVDDRRIVRRERDRRVPVPAVGRLSLRRHRTDAHRLVGHAIDAGDVAVLRLAVDDAVVLRILQDDEAVAALDRRPLVVGDAGRAAHLARAAPVVVVLHAAADVERRRHVDAHVVEEPDRQVGDEDPGLRLVPRLRQAAVVADDRRDWSSRDRSRWRGGRSGSPRPPRC